MKKPTPITKEERLAQALRANLRRRKAPAHLDNPKQQDIEKNK